MHKNFKRILVLTTGVVFILLGLFGLALPFLQGFLFLAIGLIFLSLYSSTIRGWTEVHTKQYPKLHATVKKMEEWIVKVVGRP